MSLIAIPITSGGSLQQKKKSTHSPLVLPSWPRHGRRELVLRPWWGWEGGSSVITWKAHSVVLLEITATVLSFISEAPKIWDFQVTSACPAAPCCAPGGGTQPALTLPACTTQALLTAPACKNNLFCMWC